jgi:diguanylate cyclase (GGDEF)-like protein
MLYLGIFQALGLTVLISFFNVFLRMAVQEWHVEPVPFTCYCLLMAAFILTLAAGPGKLVKDTLKSKVTWIYSLILVSTYIADTYVMLYVSATEASFFSRLSIPIALVIAWLFFQRSVKKEDWAGVGIIMLGVLWLIFLQPAHTLYITLFVVSLSAFFQTLQFVLAETHKQASEAVKAGSMRDEWRVTGLVTFATSAVFLFIAIGLSLINEYFGIVPAKLAVPLERFIDKNTILAALFYGTLILPFIRYFKWSASQNLKAENLLLFMAFIPIFTLVFEKILILSSLMPSGQNTFSEGRGIQLVSIAVLMTLGAGLATFLRLKRMLADSSENEKFTTIKAALLKGRSLAIQHSENAIDDYKIVLNTVEYAGGSFSEAAQLLDMPESTLTVLYDGKGALALDGEHSRKLSHVYFENVASRDALTGLLNRSSFMSEGKEFLESKKSVKLFYIDLDKFKPINDTYGHNAGDEVLSVISKRLQKILPEGALISRMGGDEFCALLSTRKKSEAVINELREALQKPIQLDGCDDKLIIDASIGAAAYPSDGGSLEELISHADKGMYGAKRS